MDEALVLVGVARFVQNSKTESTTMTHRAMTSDAREKRVSTPYGGGISKYAKGHNAGCLTGFLEFSKTLKSDGAICRS
jgi:hypothetical protein